MRVSRRFRIVEFFKGLDYFVPYGFVNLFDKLPAVLQFERVNIAVFQLITVRGDVVKNAVPPPP